MEITDNINEKLKKKKKMRLRKENNTGNKCPINMVRLG
jgi:hypothetical protein